MKSLFLMRHGEAPQASSDAQRMLSELGKQQCRIISQNIESEKITNVITSDYQRAIESAEIVLNTLNLQIDKYQTDLLRPVSDAKKAFDFIVNEFDQLKEGALLVVFHLPIISEIASLALDGNLKNHYSFPCASIMELKTEFSGLGNFVMVNQFIPDLS